MPGVDLFKNIGVILLTRYTTRLRGKGQTKRLPPQIIINKHEKILLISIQTTSTTTYIYV